MFSFNFQQAIRVILKKTLMVSAFILCFYSMYGQDISGKNSGNKYNYDEISKEKLRSYLDSSMLFQKRADQVENATIYLRKELAREKDSIERSNIEQEILSMEFLYSGYLQSANDYYQKAIDTGIPFPELSEPVPEGKIIDHKGNAIAGPVLIEFEDPDMDIRNETEIDSLQIADTVVAEETESIIITSVYINEFRIITSNKESDKLSVPLDEPIPEGVIYRIQIGIFKNLDSRSYFKGIEPIMAESIEGKDVIRYSVGLFSRYNDAIAALDRVKEKDFIDAFIVAFNNQKRIQVKLARTIESGEETDELDQ